MAFSPQALVRCEERLQAVLALRSPAHSCTHSSLPALPPPPPLQPQALDRWEERLEAIFDGRPYDSLDAALTDTVSKFPVDIQPFRWGRALGMSLIF